MIRRRTTVPSARVARSAKRRVAFPVGVLAVMLVGASCGSSVSTIDVTAQRQQRQDDRAAVAEPSVAVDGEATVTVNPAPTTVVDGPTAEPDDKAAAPTSTEVPAAAPTPTEVPAPPTPTSTPAVAVSEQAVALQGTDGAKALALDIRNRFILQSGCQGAQLSAAADVPDPAELSGFLEALPSEVREPIDRYYAAQDAADQVCASDEEAWTAAVADAIDALAAAEGPFGTRPVTAASTLAVAAPGEDPSITTSAMTVMYDRIYFALRTPAPEQSSDLWHSATHYAHVRGLRDLAADVGVPDLVILGDSVAARGVDARVISDELGRVAVNLGLFSSYPEGQLALSRQLLQSGEPETIVWVLYPHIIFTRGCQHQQRIAIDPVEKPQERENLAFAPVPWLAGTSKTDLFFGAVEATNNYDGTQLQEKADQLHDPWVEQRGTPFSQDGLDQERIERQRETSVGRYENPEACQARLDSIAVGIKDWVDSGHEVHVVIPPTSDMLVEMHPDGRAGHDEVIATLEASARAGGAEFADLSRTVPEADFHDLVHVNTDGRPTFTQGVIDALQR